LFSIVDADNTFPLDPSLLLSDKSNRSFISAKENILCFSPTGHRVGNTEVKSGFIPSLFENVPPTIRFCTENQRSMNIISHISLYLSY
jgi:hypothetical protein